MSVPFQAPAAFNPRQPFSRAEARAAGLTAEMLLSRRFHKIFWDTYVAREVLITPLQRAKAVIRLVPSGSYISHHTAAELWGAAAPADGATHVTLPSACGRLVRQGVSSHYRNDSAQTMLRKGLPISTPEQTFFDLAAIGVGLVDLVVVADGLIKAGHTSSELLIAAAGQGVVEDVGLRAGPHPWHAKVWTHRRKPDSACSWCWPVFCSASAGGRPLVIGGAMSETCFWFREE
jgi:hypothetical protein